MRTERVLGVREFEERIEPGNWGRELTVMFGELKEFVKLSVVSIQFLVVFSPGFSEGFCGVFSEWFHQLFLWLFNVSINVKLSISFSFWADSALMSIQECHFYVRSSASLLFPHSGFSCSLISPIKYMGPSYLKILPKFSLICHKLCFAALGF